MNGLTIGQIAEQVNISRDAIRLYERQGLIERPERGANGYRLYSKSTVTELHFIKHAQKMGFSLKEISGLLNMNRSCANVCEKVHSEAEVKIKNITSKITELQRIKKLLALLIKECGENKENKQCAILKALEQEDFNKKK